MNVELTAVYLVQLKATKVRKLTLVSQSKRKQSLMVELSRIIGKLPCEGLVEI